MGRSIPPLQQLPHGLIENRIAPQRQHITHGKHITHDNQHINKQHEHQPIGEAMTNHHAEDGDKKSILDARIERAYANEYDAAFAAATIKNYASLPLATILADHPQLLKRCTKIMGDPDIRKLTDPYAPKRDNDSYVLTVGCLAHMLTALDTKLKLEWEPDERHELESKRNTLRTALFIPLDGLKRCNVELNTQARQKPGTTGQKTPRPHAAIVDRNRYNRMTAHFSAEGAAIRTLIDLLCLLSINELFEGYLALVPATAPKSVAKIIETCRRQFERHRNGSEMNASIAQYYAAHYKKGRMCPYRASAAARLHHARRNAPSLWSPWRLRAARTGSLPHNRARSQARTNPVARQPLRGQQSYSTTQPTERSPHGHQSFPHHQPPHHA